MPSPELTLIVAATRQMGIGAKGTMPWQGLREEMRYFARVTSRLPPEASPGAANAVIMGRKTWESIPPKFRPLKNRLNIILTRDAPSTSVAPPSPSTLTAEAQLSQPVHVSTVDAALAHAAAASGRVFVMGGAQIYDVFMALPAAKRVLLTSIERDFECDTFFPVDLQKAEGWVKRSWEEARAWTGEDGDAAREEAGTKYEFQMWEKED